MKKEKVKEEPSSQFQRQRVDMLLGELVRKFPVPQAGPPEQSSKTDEDKAASTAKSEGKAEATPNIKQEPMDTNTNDSVSSQPQIKQEPLAGPPEKKLKLNS